MAFEIFGYKITKNKKEEAKAVHEFVPTPVTPSNNDGSTIVSVGNSAMMSGYYQYNFDIDGVVRNDAQMISQYRACASYPDVDTAIEAIVNEAVIVDQSRKPVEINPRNFNRDISLSKAEAIVAVAGPVMNFILAIVFELIACAVIKFAPGFYATTAGMITYSILTSIVTINLGLGIFNLIPLPPLDGSKVLNAFLPYNARNWMDTHSQIFEIVFIALWIVGILSLIVSPIISLAYSGLSHLCASIFGLVII